MNCCMQDKILQSMGRSNDIMVTNDGATILKSLYVDNPAAKVLVGKACPEDALHYFVWNDICSRADTLYVHRHLKGAR